MAFLLTALAGYVDALAYLSLGHVYVANMSGNSVAIGIHASTPELWRFAWPVISFTLGLLVSRLIIGWALYRQWRSAAALSIAVESAALAGFALVPPGATGVFLAACAMGMQAATLSRFNGITVYTCFVTGSLVKFAEHTAQVVVDIAGRKTVDAGQMREALWFAGIWAAYVAGAALGVVALQRFAGVATVIPIGVLIALAMADLIYPARIDDSVEAASQSG